MQGHCELAHCLLPQLLPFPPHSFSELGQNLQVFWSTGTHAIMIMSQILKETITLLSLATCLFFLFLPTHWVPLCFCELFFFNFTINNRLICCSVFILVISLEEQQSPVTLIQAQRQTNWYRETSLLVVRFEKLQGWCECSQSRYLTATPHTEWTSAIL
jgi:hypothetical protein